MRRPPSPSALFLTLLVGPLAACGDGSAGPPSVDAGDGSTIDAAGSPDAAAPALPALTFCRVANARNINAAYVTLAGDDWVSYSCADPCDDWSSCGFEVLDAQGNPLLSARGTRILGLVFVVDGLGGHFAYTEDGTDVVVTHAGSGGTSTYNPFDVALQRISDLKTVTLGWAHGTDAIFGGGGWFTRKDAQPTTVRALAVRPAAAIQWIKDNFAAGVKLGTVGSSMGTAATFGAHVWYGLDPILDYQMLIGGPGFWDVNAGCGRVHIAAGHCDADVSACTGNAFSSYGNDDPTCDATATNHCRVPTVMAPRGATGSSYNDCINYVGVTTACTPSDTDARDASLDASSLASTVASWTFRGPVELIADEGGDQPPNADQGMGEGHMMYVYASITSAKRWTDNEGTHHGDAWNTVPALVAAAAAQVATGMGH